MNKLFLLTVVVSVIVAAAFIILRKFTRKCAPLALACAIVLAALLAPVAMAYTVAGLLMVSIVYLALAG